MSSSTELSNMDNEAMTGQRLSDMSPWFYFVNCLTSANNIGEVTVNDNHRQQDNNTSGSLPMRGGEREDVFIGSV